jgi:hypothetical protein
MRPITRLCTRVGGPTNFFLTTWQILYMDELKVKRLTGKVFRRLFPDVSL